MINWKNIFRQVVIGTLLFAGIAHAQPGPPPNLVVGSTPVVNGSSGNCLTVVAGRLQQTACVPSAVIDPAHGGTGTTTVFTPGSNVYAGGSGIYQQDNANWFFDATNKRIGIGTASPLSMLHIVGKGNVADGVQIDSTTQARAFINNTDGSATKRASVVFAKNGTASWSIQTDQAADGTNNLNFFDSIAAVNRLQIGASGNLSLLSGGFTGTGSVAANSSTSIPAGGTAGTGLKVSSAANFGVSFGSGVPTLSAAQGSLYLRSDGVPYYNVDGATTWASLGTGTGTVNGGLINQLAWYAGSGSAVSGLTTANNGLLVTSGGGVPSIATAIPNGVTTTTQVTNDNSTKVASTAAVWAGITQGKNVARNPGMVYFPRGTTTTVAAAASGFTSLGAAGWKITATGATVTANMITETTARNGALNSLQLVGATSVTNLAASMRIEATEGAQIASQTATFQFAFFNNTGGSVTPTLDTCYATASNNFGTCSTDLSSIALQACADATWCTLAYSFAVHANAVNGYQVNVGFGNNFSTSGKSVKMTAVDLRSTPGMVIGLNATPPLPQLTDISEMIRREQRYVATSWEVNTFGGSTTKGMCGPGIFVNGVFVSATSCQFPVPMRGTPTMTIYDGAGTLNTSSVIANSGGTSFTNGGTAGSAFNTSSRGFNYEPFTSDFNYYTHYVAYADFW